MKTDRQGPCPVLKGSLPFRLGTTSYILADDLVPNVTYLADKIDDVELVLFESHEVSNLPDETSLSTLASLAENHDLTYTVHLPLDADLGDADEHIRQRSVDKCLNIYRLTQCLCPFAYILHLHGRQPGKEPAEHYTDWQCSLEQSIVSLLDQGIPAADLCVETLTYPFDYVWDLVRFFNLSVCIDVGHILLIRENLERYLDILMDRCRVVHLHGIRKGKDHCDIGALPLDVLKRVLNRLRSCAPRQERVLTLEVFNANDFNRSIERLRSVL